MGSRIIFSENALLNYSLQLEKQIYTATLCKHTATPYVCAYAAPVCQFQIWLDSACLSCDILIVY